MGIFTRWLPIGEEYGIEVTNENMELLFWFEYELIHNGKELNAEEAAKHINLLAYKIKARIVIELEDHCLANYIQQGIFSENSTDKEVIKKHIQLCQDLIKFLIERINRLISYVRDIKGQYWLLKYSYSEDQLPNLIQHFKAQAKIDDMSWVEFRSTELQSITFCAPSDEKYITKNDWVKLGDFVSSDRNIPLKNELLSNAEKLLGNGYFRSALIEAVTALELSLSSFSKSTGAKERLSSIYGDRIDTPSFDAQVKRFGTSKTIMYLLPLLLNEKTLPKKIIQGCQKAITLRQNIIHNGQRVVDEQLVFATIINIRIFCQILDDFSNNIEPVNN